MFQPNARSSAVQKLSAATVGGFVVATAGNRGGRRLILLKRSYNRAMSRGG
jgi:hypothetical protein